MIKVDLLVYRDKKYITLSSLTNYLIEYVRQLEEDDHAAAASAISHVLASALEWQAR